jgi:hypothetical protein
VVDPALLNLRSPLRIPAARQRITFSFIGLSLSVPERARFRYRLDDFDRDWSEPVAGREAVSRTGAYRFGIIGSNSDGIWNSTETAVALEVTPQVWQTWWFCGAAVVSCMLAVIAMYLFRLHQATRQLNIPPRS